MKILLLHNSYQRPGGEDLSVERESAILRAAGHQVVTYFRNNDEIGNATLVAKIATGAKAIWARDSHRELNALLEREKPDLAHFHNTFPLISPSAYYACRDADVPVVQTLHNYRLLCPPGTFFRNGGVCEECTEHSLWRGVQHGCYRDSRAGTAAVALMLAVHRGFKTWSRTVDCYVALTQFAREKFIAAGLPPGKIVVKPNCTYPDPGEGNWTRDYALFVGRLDQGKGVGTLVAAWARLRVRIPLHIVGDGPLGAELGAQASQLGPGNIHIHGQLSHERTLEFIKGARFLVFPSEWYEGFPLTIAEAFACGTPVLCSRLGAMQEIVADGGTGLHFTPGDSADLSAKVQWAWTHANEIEAMGKAARAEYEARYTAEQDYRMLMRIYEFALQRAGEAAREPGSEIGRSPMQEPRGSSLCQGTRAAAKR